MLRSHRSILFVALALGACATAEVTPDDDAGALPKDDVVVEADAKAAPDAPAEDVVEAPDVVAPQDDVVTPDDAPAPPMDAATPMDAAAPADVPPPRDAADVPPAMDVVDVPPARDVVDVPATPDIVDVPARPDIVDVPVVCPAGRADCNRRADDGCEVDLALDPANCGACGRTGTEVFNGRDDDCDGVTDEGFSSNGVELTCTGSGLVLRIADGDVDDGGGSSGGDSLEVYCAHGALRFCLSGESCPWRGATPPEDGRNCSTSGLRAPSYFMAYYVSGYFVVRGVRYDEWYCPPTGRVRLALR